ncbi:MAG TPA: NAD(P)/FAD-dependent oxidoreductase [Vitreimonas sp.]|uniref:flavin monoamine oxidase family protein n=1 Tax=Vitreimonas sp. TaxID=3069702 RepID=UPI002D26B471|nr:NAD(P)/FAD-dependent oxidoreductase [Vitreimonas sp.]HYD88828.1 NAD(P)/FAD-dependent oxidoreductase [Vitreimonas sp.]
MADLYDVAIVGAGAAGIGAGRRLARSAATFVLLEAQERVGGRTLTIARNGHALDLGAGWLHSADRNVMVALGEAAGFEIDHTEAPWEKQTAAHGMSAEEQAEFRSAFRAFEAHIAEQAEQDGARPASFYFEPDCRWNPLLDAVFSYISGAHLSDIDARDYARYEDTGKNWRVRAGYGALLTALAAPLPVKLQTQVRGIDQTGANVRIATGRGTVEARAAIVTLPPWAIAQLAISPALPKKAAAGQNLPLGAAEKLFFELSRPEEFPIDGHLFARTDSAATGSYHLRPMGRPLIEVYFGGPLARGLAQAGVEAMADFARQELAGLLGSRFPSRLTLLAASSWSTAEHARGAYSFARPGGAEARAVMAAPAGRLYFAGEACSRERYSTVHGAYQTGHEAAESALARLAGEAAA